MNFYSSKTTHPKYVKKGLAILSLLVVFFIILLSQLVSKGYELSIYRHYPPTVLYLLVLLVGFCVLFGILCDKSLVIYFSVPILILLSLVQVLPSLLGYAAAYGDVSTHFGFARNIQTTGLINPMSSRGHYPVIHIIWVISSEVTELTIESSNTILKILSIWVFTLLSGVLSHEYSGTYGYSFLFIPIGFLTVNVPASFTYMIPFLLIITLYSIENGAIRWYCLLFIAFILIWVSHPISSVLLLLGMLLYHIISLVYPIFSDYTFKDFIFNNYGLTILYSIIGFIWFAYFTDLFRLSVSNFASLLLDTNRQTASDFATTALFEILGLNLLDILKLGILKYGDLGVLLTFIFLGIFIVMRMGEWPRRRTFPILPVILIFITLPLFIEEFLFNMINALPYQRTIRPILSVGPALAGISLDKVLQYKSNSSRSTLSSSLPVILALILVSGILISFFGMYPGPATYDRNDQISGSEIEGYDWFFEYKQDQITTVVLDRSPKRYADLLLSEEEIMEKSKAIQYDDNRHLCRLPKHFAPRTELGELFDGMYYVEPYSDQLWVETMDLNRYNKQDFQEIQADKTVHRIYSSQGMDLYVIGLQANPNTVRYPDSCVKDWYVE